MIFHINSFRKDITLIMKNRYAERCIIRTSFRRSGGIDGSRARRPPYYAWRKGARSINGILAWLPWHACNKCLIISIYPSQRLPIHLRSYLSLHQFSSCQKWQTTIPFFFLFSWTWKVNSKKVVILKAKTMVVNKKIWAF